MLVHTASASSRLVTCHVPPSRVRPSRPWYRCVSLLPRPAPCSPCQAALSASSSMPPSGFRTKVIMSTSTLPTTIRPMPLRKPSTVVSASITSPHRSHAHSPARCIFSLPMLASCTLSRVCSRPGHRPMTSSLSTSSLPASRFSASSPAQESSSTVTSQTSYSPAVLLLTASPTVRPACSSASIGSPWTGSRKSRRGRQMSSSSTRNSPREYLNHTSSLSRTPLE